MKLRIQKKMKQLSFIRDQLMAQLIQDRYLGFHYARELEAQGMKVSMNQMANGAIEIEAREMVW